MRRRVMLQLIAKGASAVSWSPKEKACSFLGGAKEQAMADAQTPYKATGVGALTLTPVFTSTYPGLADTSKLAISLSLRPPDPSRHGADNERPTV
jgi:hypothetical protein